MFFDVLLPASADFHISVLRRFSGESLIPNADRIFSLSSSFVVVASREVRGVINAESGLAQFSASHTKGPGTSDRTAN